jgi:multicomponent Na+:H+ antiporter subunit E
MQRYRRPALQALVLLALWLVLSGKFDAFHVGMGVASVALVLWLNRALLGGTSLEPGPTRPMDLLSLATYVPWLAWKMVASGLYVAYLSLHPRMPVSPVLIRFRSHQPSVSAQVILGNSITVTPGTLTLAIEDDQITVHSLTGHLAEELGEGTLSRRVARLFGARPEPALSDVRTLDPPALPVRDG